MNQCASVNYHAIVSRLSCYCEVPYAQYTFPNIVGGIADTLHETKKRDQQLGMSVGF